MREPGDAALDAFRETRQPKIFCRLSDDFQFLCRGVRFGIIAALILEQYSFRAAHPAEYLKFSEADLERHLRYGAEIRTIRAARNYLIQMGLLLVGSKDGKGTPSCRVDFLAVQQRLQELREWQAANKGKDWAEAPEFRPAKGRPRGVHVLTDADRYKFVAKHRSEQICTNLEPLAGSGQICTNLAPAPEQICTNSEADLPHSNARIEANLPTLPYKNGKNVEELARREASSLDAKIRSKTQGVLLSGLPIDEHTVRVISKAFAALEEKALTVLDSTLERIIRQHRERAVTWGVVVSQLQKYVGEQPAEPEPEPIMAADPVPLPVRAEYTPEEIRREVLHPLCLGAVADEAALDRSRAARSPAHAAAVRERWRIPYEIDVPAAGEFLDRTWAEEWYLQWYFGTPYRRVPRKSPGVEIHLRVTKMAVNT